MATGIKNTPNYEKTKNSMFWASMRKVVWGTLAAGLTVGGIASCAGLAVGVGLGSTLVILGGPILGGAMIAAGLFAGWRAYKANVDEKSGYAEISAQRTAQLVAQKIQDAISVPSISPEEQVAYKNWQQQVEAQRAMAQQAPSQAIH